MIDPSIYYVGSRRFLSCLRLILVLFAILLPIPDTIYAAIGISITPTSVSLGAASTQDFSAKITGTANRTVTWSMSPSIGTLSSTGIYQSPASISDVQIVKVTATSV